VKNKKKAKITGLFLGFQLLAELFRLLLQRLFLSLENLLPEIFLWHPRLFVAFQLLQFHLHGLHMLDERSLLSFQCFNFPQPGLNFYFYQVAVHLLEIAILALIFAPTVLSLSFWASSVLV
jgi:hypothetical protein